MNQLMQIIESLRGEHGCPWDKKQTLASLKRCLLEETHEVMEAITEGSSEKIEEELGDLLAVISMMLAIGKEENRFTDQSVLEKIQDKLQRRHPHVFGDEKAASADHAREFWDREKDKEKSQQKEWLLDNVGKGYPALLEAYKIGKKVKKVGFDWSKPEEVMEKIDEELAELKVEISKREHPKIQEELGDFLFTAAHLARHLGVDPEEATLSANSKFRKRFQRIEAQAREAGKDLKECSLEELENFWQTAKQEMR